MSWTKYLPFLPWSYFLSHSAHSRIPKPETTAAASSSSTEPDRCSTG